MNISDFPLKLYYSIGEVSQIVGVEPHVLRYWESEFRNISPAKADSGRRQYKRKDVETILLIRHLLYERKFTIAGAKKHLAEAKGAHMELFDLASPAPAAERTEQETPPLPVAIVDREGLKGINRELAEISRKIQSFRQNLMQEQDEG